MVSSSCSTVVSPAALSLTLKISADKLRLKRKDLAKLYKQFLKYDKDKSGTIEVKEFFDLIREPQTLFGEAIFKIVDLDGSGALDFSEFVEAVGVSTSSFSYPLFFSLFVDMVS